MYEFIVLSLLMNVSSLHGYLMAKIANDKIGPWTRLSSGTLYPLLTKLERAGLIERVVQGNDSRQEDQHFRAFAITEEGRKRFRQLMLDTSNQGDYQRLFRLKVVYLDLLHPGERLHLLNHYINYCRTSILHFQAEAEDFMHEQASQESMSGFHRETVLSLMQHMIEQWQAEVDWTSLLSKKVIAELENSQEQPRLEFVDPE